MSRYKMYYLVSFAFIVMTSTLGSRYREYIYSRGIQDFGLADMHTNIGAVLVASFLFFGIAKVKEYASEVRIIVASMVGLILYEIAQLKISYATFDVLDIIGTIIGGLVAIILHRIIFTLYKIIKKR